MGPEQKFSSSLVSSFKAFPDIFQCTVANQPWIPGRGYQQKKPFDMWAIKDGIFIAIELKSIEGIKDFKIDCLADHQIDSLQKIKKCGGLGLVAVQWRIKGNPQACVYDIDTIVKKERISIGQDCVLKLRRVKIDGRIVWSVNEIFTVGGR